MAGVKGRSGGKREGAGRKPKERKKIDQGLIEGIEDVYAEMPKCNMGVPLFPKELVDVPFAKEAWEYAVSCDKESSIHLLNGRHYEALKSYCIAVSQRRLLISEWVRNGKPIQYIDDRGNIKIHPLMKEMDSKNKQVNEYAEALGLTVLGEYKLAKTHQISPTLAGDDDASDKTGDMFE